MLFFKCTTDSHFTSSGNHLPMRTTQKLVKFVSPVENLMFRPVLPFARKFPCKRKFWYLQGKMQGNKIDKEIARKSSLKQGNCKEF